MKDEYIIISKTAIQKRIEELLQDNKELAYSDEANPYGLGAIAGKIEALKQILSQSTPLIPEIEKSIKYGFNVGGQLSKLTPKMFQDYISNLKLDI